MKKESNEELEKTKQITDEEISEIQEEIKPKVKKALPKWVIPTVAGVVVLGIAAALYFFVFAKEEVLSTYTLEELDTTFKFEGTGTIVSAEEATYDLKETAAIEFLVSDYPSAGDKIVVDESLFTYKETTDGEELSVGTKPNFPGTVAVATEETVEVDLEPTGEDLVMYTPVIGDCALFITDKSGTDFMTVAVVRGVQSIITGEKVTFNIVSAGYDIEAGDTSTVHYQTTLRSELHGCNNLAWENDKIVVIGVGQGDPAYTSSNGVFNIVTQTYTDDAQSPGANYKLTEEIGLNVSVGDSVTTSTYLYKDVYTEQIATVKTLKSLVKGEVKTVVLDVPNGAFKIVIYDTDKNYLTFDVTEDFLDKIAIGSTALLSDDEVEITADVNGIEEGVASIANANFKNYDLEKEFIVAIEGSGETIILIPKNYVKDNKVKKVSGETTTEVDITYEEYNEENYKLTGGVAKGDLLEEYK